MTSAQWSDLPEVYHPDFPEVVPSEVAHKSPEVLIASKYDAYCGGLESLDHDRSSSAVPEVETKQAERRICGMKRGLFIIVSIIGAIIIIGAIVGGAVGGTIASKAAKSSASNSTATATATTAATTPTATNTLKSISPKSSIASVNWTDSSGYDHYYVFHQARDQSIISSTWDSQNSTWQTRNVSADIAKTSSGDLDVIQGTPISAISWRDNSSDWNIRVFVLLKGNLIAELYTQSPSPDSKWAQYPTSPLGFTTGPGSNLAAWRANGGGPDTYPIMLAWQDDGKLMYANGTGETWTDVQSFGEQAVNKTGIAMTDLFDGKLAWKLYFDSSGAMLEMQGDPADIAGYGFGNNKGSIGDLTSARTANYAAAGFNEIYLLVVNLDGDGTLVARYYDGTQWSAVTEPNLLNAPKDVEASSNFTAVSMNRDKRIYTVFEDFIYEWRFAEFKPTDWTYVGRVNVTIST